MPREKTLLRLLADDLRSLHFSALALEKDLYRLSEQIDSDNIGSLAGLIGQINCTGFAPIEKMLRDAGITTNFPHGTGQPVLRGVLAEANGSLERADSRPIGPANAISIMRRAARYMEMYCASIAESAFRLRLDRLALHLRAWAREWIGLELNLNAVAARPREREAATVAA